MNDFETLVHERKNDTLNVLFVCASNICRSPYAEFWFKRLLNDLPVLKNRVTVASGAVFNRSRNMFPKTRILMLGEGWTEEEIARHVPAYKRDYPERFNNADVIIGMTRMQKILCPHREKFLTLSEAVTDHYIKIRDPWTQKTQPEFDTIMHQISTCMPQLMSRIEGLLKR